MPACTAAPKSLRAVEREEGDEASATRKGVTRVGSQITADRDWGEGEGTN